MSRDIFLANLVEWKNMELQSDDSVFISQLLLNPLWLWSGFISSDFCFLICKIVTKIHICHANCVVKSTIHVHQVHSTMLGTVALCLNYQHSILYFFPKWSKDHINFTGPTCPHSPIPLSSWRISFHLIKPISAIRKLFLATFLLLPIPKELIMASSVLPLCLIDNLRWHVHSVTNVSLLIYCLLLPNRSHVFICISQIWNQA